MEVAIDRVMRTYGMIQNLTPQQEADARSRVERHLNGMEATENALAVEGLRFLRDSARPVSLRHNRRTK